MHGSKIPAILVSIVGTLTVSAEQLPITVDGDVADWGAAPPAIVDPAGDGTTVDFLGVWTADDSHRHGV